MTVSERHKSPDFFEAHELDPLTAASGRNKAPRAAVAKKKAGFYLSEALLKRFNRRFHQLKLEGVTIENKSALLELALAFALDDLDKGDRSVLADALK
jgi:hypothetical protein